MTGFLFLYLLYFIGFLWLNSKTGFFIKSGLSVKTINVLFSLKAVAGLLFIYVNYTLTETDLGASFKNSLLETKLLSDNPLLFITSLFQHNYDNAAGGILSTHNSYWNDIRTVVLDKLLAVLNVFSLKNLYINSLLFNYLVFYAHIALYRSFAYAGITSKPVKITGCFLIPSSLFYLSGINKDSLFFWGLCLAIFATVQLLQLPRKNLLPALLLLLVGLGITFVIRNFFFFLLIPAVTAYWISKKMQTNPLYVFLPVYAVLTAAFLLSPFLMQAVCDRQEDFLQLGWAKSFITVKKLEPNFMSMAAHLPTAFDIGFLRPYIWHSYSLFYFASAAEVLLVSITVLWGITAVIKTKLAFFKNPFIVLSIFYAVSCILLIAYSTSYLGAVIRYKTAFLPFLVTPFLYAVLCLFQKNEKQNIAD
jgi:hypothetical protein